MNQSNGRPNFSGGEIIKEIDPKNGRRVVIRSGSTYKPVNADQNYDLKQLLGKNGKPNLTTIPPRVKG